MSKVLILALALVMTTMMFSIVQPIPAQAIDWCQAYAESGFNNHAAGLMCAIVLAWDWYCGGGYLEHWWAEGSNLEQ